MNEIQCGLLALLPPKQKSTPSGWISVNAPCCHSKGERSDTKQRGGVLLNQDGGFQWHCFNCGFKAGWRPGNLLSRNTRSLFKWIGMPETDIQKLNLIALKLKDNQPISKKLLSFELVEKELPAQCLPINQWLEQNTADTDLLDVISYLVNERKVEWDWYNWHWSAASGYRDRVILPFYQNGKIVGHTGRKIKAGKPKYLSDAQPGYVFNIDRQTYKRNYVIVVEGQFDAIAIDGVAIMTNEPNEAQVARINALGKSEVIVVPDRDRAGAKMIVTALANKWTVSIPPWQDDIKDVADAVKRYGRLYTLFTILHYREHNEIKIQLLKKKLENINND